MVQTVRKDCPVPPVPVHNFHGSTGRGEGGKFCGRNRGGDSVLPHSRPGPVGKIPWQTVWKEHQLDATQVILAAGPWTPRLLPRALINGERSHSIVIEPVQDVSPTIIFFDPGHFDPDDKENQLEVYPRPDNIVYMCGRTDYGAPIPATTDDVEVNPRHCNELMNNLAIISPDLTQSRVLIRQACFRPIVYVEGRAPELGPLLGFTGIKGLILAAGHNQWGIHTSPIAGKVISELVFEGRAVSAGISQLDPMECLKLE